MNTDTVSNERLIGYRLIALWVVCETLLGGIIHSFNLPFSSILLSGSSVICICLLAKVTGKGGILKATVIVVLFKFLLSPQTPPAAYLAVFMQGIFGEVFFSSVRNYKISCVLVGIFSLAESAIQRIIILLILFGNDFPKAINKFVQSAFSKNVNTNYSMYLASLYVLIHIIMGGLIGYFAFSIWQKNTSSGHAFRLDMYIPETDQEKVKKKNKKTKWWLLVIWIILVALLIYSWIFPANRIFSPRSILLMLIRSVIILLTWYLFLSPVLLFYFKKWVEKKKQKLHGEIQEIILLLPATKYVIKQSWVNSSGKKGIKRILLCCRIIAYNTLLPGK